MLKKGIGGGGNLKTFKNPKERELLHHEISEWEDEIGISWDYYLGQENDDINEEEG